MSSRPSMSTSTVLERILALELARVTERAAVAAARLRGRGDEKAADQAAVDAMRRELNNLPIDGTVVIGEGERDEAPMLFIGEKVGTRRGPKVDIAVDPLEGTTLCAKDMPGAIAAMAMARGRHVAATRPTSIWTRSPSAPAIRKGIVDLDAPPEDNIRALAKAKGVKPADDHRAASSTGRATPISSPPCARPARRVRLITDGDVAGVIHTAEPEETGIDIYHRHRRRARRRAGGGGAALHRRPDAGAAGVRHRGEARARRARWASRTRARNTTWRTGAGRLLFAATGVTDGAHAQAASGSAGHHRDRNGGDALGHRHGALDPRRAPPAGEVSFVGCDL